MMLSKLWFLILGAVVALCTSAVVLSQQTFNRHVEETVRDQTRRDRFEVELWLKGYARLRADALLAVVGDAELRRDMAASASKSALSGPEKSKLVSRMRDINENKLGELKAELLFAVNEEGIVLAQLGGQPTPPGGGLGQLPVVRSALAGYISDDVWVYENKAYFVAARPVVERGAYAGAVVHGIPIDASFAQKLGERIPGATIGFFVGRDMVASHVPSTQGEAPRKEALAAGLDEALQSERVQAGQGSETLHVTDHASAVYALFQGSGRKALAGFVVARPRIQLQSPFDVFELATSKDTTSALVPLLLTLGLCVLLAAVGLLFIRVEFGGPMKRFLESLRRIERRKEERIQATALPTTFRRAAMLINDVLDQASLGRDRPSGVNIDEVLGASGPGKQPKTSPYFGFSQAPPPPDESTGEPTRAQRPPPTRANLASGAQQQRTPFATPHQGPVSLPPEELDDMLMDDRDIHGHQDQEDEDFPFGIPSANAEGEAQRADSVGEPYPSHGSVSVSQRPGAFSDGALSGARSQNKDHRKRTIMMQGGDSNDAMAHGANSRPSTSEVPTQIASVAKPVVPAAGSLRHRVPTLSASEALREAIAPPGRKEKRTMMGNPVGPGANQTADAKRSDDDTLEDDVMPPTDDAAMHRSRPGSPVQLQKPAFGGGRLGTAPRAGLQAPRPVSPSRGLGQARNQPQEGAFESQELDLHQLQHDEEATVATAETQNLIAAMTRAKAPAVADDEKDFRRLYDEYRNLRLKCGESIQELTFEKFERSLRKSRAQIKARHGNVQVVFKIWEKSGKAAIKASPQK